VAPPITQISFVVSLVINSLSLNPAVPNTTLTGLKQRLGHAAVFSFHCSSVVSSGPHSSNERQDYEKLRKWDGCEGRESREIHTMMFTAAVVEVLASTGIPVPGLNATLLNLNPSAGDLFQDPWNGT
jgi:hypothetical protein